MPNTTIDLFKKEICPICGEPHRVIYANKFTSNGTRIPDKSMIFVKCPKTNNELYLVRVEK